MGNDRHGSNGSPATSKVTSKVTAKIATLERRLHHLHQRLSKPNYSASNSSQYDREEASALEAAVTVMRYHRLLGACTVVEDEQAAALRYLIRASDIYLEGGRKSDFCLSLERARQVAVHSSLGELMESE